MNNDIHITVKSDGYRERRVMERKMLALLILGNMKNKIINLLIFFILYS